MRNRIKIDSSKSAILFLILWLVDCLSSFVAFCSYDGLTLHDQLLENYFERTSDIFTVQIISEQVQGPPTKKMMVYDERSSIKTLDSRRIMATSQFSGARVDL